MQRHVPDWAAVEAAADRFEADRLSGWPLLRETGRPFGHRREHLPVLHPGSAQHPLAGLLDSLHRCHRGPYVKDFKALWATNFLDDLSAETHDYVFANGVVGKVVLYNMEERQRVKIVDYVGSKQVEQSKIDEELKKQSIQIRLDSFIDEGLVRRVAGVVHDLYAEKGYEYAEVKPEIKPVAGGTKTVNLTFNITEGPKVKIRSIDFIGNQAIHDGTLARKMKENKAPGFLKFITGAGTYKEAKFEDDAEKVVGYYRDQGYVKARVGQPELKILEDSKDGKNRYIELQVPVTEGQRYRVGEFSSRATPW